MLRGSVSGQCASKFIAALVPSLHWLKSNDSSASCNSDEGIVHLSTLSPTSPLYYFHPNPHVEICYDARSRVPLYVMERLGTRFSTSKSSSHERQTRQRRPRLVQDTRLPAEFRSRHDHYRASGYDRGHMVPAADFPHEMAINFFTNICPQAPLLNRGLWNRLEQYVRKLASQCDTIVVISGPLWLPERKLQEELFEYRYVGLGQPPALVSVPTHFFKLIVVFDTSQQHIQEYAAFVIPNQNESSGRAADYLVRWSDLESVVGMRFFARLATNEQDWKVQADAAADKLLQEPSSQQLLLEARRNKNNKRQSVLPRGPDHLCRSSRCNF